MARGRSALSSVVGVAGAVAVDAAALDSGAATVKNNNENEEEERNPLL